MRSAWQDGDRVRDVEVTPLGQGRYAVTVDGGTLEVEARVLGQGGMRLVHAGGVSQVRVTDADSRRFVRVGSLDFVLERTTVATARGTRAARAAGSDLASPMPGVVTRVMVAAGDPVRKGQTLLAVEAMKMEHMIRAPRDGRVVVVRARAGDMVMSGVPLVELEESP